MQDDSAGEDEDLPQDATSGGDASDNEPCALVEAEAGQQDMTADQQLALALLDNEQQQAEVRNSASDQRLGCGLRNEHAHAISWNAADCFTRGLLWVLA